MKSKISVQSKKNFILERDVRYLDSRIALLIQNRMALDEVIIIIDKVIGLINWIIINFFYFPYHQIETRSGKFA